MTIESQVFHSLSLGSSITGKVLVHVVAGAIVAVIAGVVSAVRAGTIRRPFLPYSERYLVGLALGIITSLAISVTYGSWGAGSPGEAIENSGVFMYYSLVSLLMPVACVVGGLTWHLLSRARGGAPAPARPRRPIEDPE